MVVVAAADDCQYADLQHPIIGGGGSDALIGVAVLAKNVTIVVGKWHLWTVDHLVHLPIPEGYCHEKES